MHGKESDRIPEASGAGGRGQSVASDRPRAWSARPQHHGILQSFQRADAEGREEHADPGGDHDLCRSFVYLRDEDAADVLLPQASRQDPVRLQGAGPRQGRQGDPRPGARDRREEDEGSQLRFRRVGHEDGRGLRPFDGSGSCGVTGMAIGKRLAKAREGVNREKLYPLAEAIKMVKERAKSKFDETIEIAMNLGVDPRHADQMVRGVVTLPNGTGLTLRVGVFARGAKADEARAAGADVVGAEDLVEKVQ